MPEPAATPDEVINAIPLRIQYGRDGKPHPIAPEDCEPHTPSPTGYLAWDEWAERMDATHAARQCKGCGLWAIWEPKVIRDA